MRGKNEAGHLRLRGRMDVGDIRAEIQRTYTSAVSQIQPYFATLCSSTYFSSTKSAGFQFPRCKFLGARHNFV
jgi:hypothetical protein